MHLRPPRLTIRSLMLAVVLLAVVSAVILPKLRPPAPPRYRYLEVYYREPDGTLAGIRRESFTFEGSDWRGSTHRRPDQDNTLHGAIEQAKAAGMDYRLTAPRGWDGHGRPIY